MMAPHDIPNSNGANAAVAVVLGIYLVLVLSKGNIPELAKAAQQDFLGDNTQKPFWRWFLAVMVLWYLTTFKQTQHLFGPLFSFALVAMLIEATQGKGKGSLKNLMSGISQLFGFKEGK